MQYEVNKGSKQHKNWYSHITKEGCEHKDITVLWNEGIQTDREVLNNYKQDKIYAY
jgi:hypothetical protein